MNSKPILVLALICATSLLRPSLAAAEDAPVSAEGTPSTDVNRPAAIEFFSLTPIIGMEVTRIGVASIGNSNTVTFQGLRVAPALTFGAIAGIRLGPLGLGLLFQQTEGQKAEDSHDVAMTKLYGQVSVQVPWNRVVGLMHMDFGWAVLATQGIVTHGIGGKLGVALDYYPVRWVSIGAGADFDVQGYRTPSSMLGSYGGTFVARFGLHL